MRQHDGDGVSREAYTVINRHGLDMDNVLKWAERYRVKETSDFNLALVADFEGAPLGRRLSDMVEKLPAFDPFRERFNKALRSFDYGTSDGIMDKCLQDGIVVRQGGETIYSWWMRYAERLEGANIALVRAAKSAKKLCRFLLDIRELGNYRDGMWRMVGDKQDRVSTTVGASNFQLDEMAVAMVTYDAGALAGHTQPVRYSPYPRQPDTALEGFGHEKDGRFVGEGEVHVHVGCPIPAPKYINIAILAAHRHRREEIVERYGDVATVE